MVTFYWNNPAGGQFQNSFNWNTDPPDTPPIRWPGFGTTIFNLDPANFITPFYRVEFLHDALSTDLIVENPVEFDLNNFTFSLTNSIVVGDRTKNAALTLRNGTLQGANANLGRGTDSKGQITVSGNGSKWELTSTDGEVLEIGLGLGSQGSLIVENGGKVINNGQTRVGEGGTGTILVTGAGSLWRNAGRILLGAFYGTGIMNVEAGGRVESQFGVISGDRSDSTGTGQATITGNGSTWANTEFLTIGESRQGTLLIENGGLVSNTFGLIGLSSTGVGTVTVKDNGSKWNNSEYLDIGIQGNGTLNILNGGTVANVSSTIGVEADSKGQVTVDGAASLWNNSADLTVGRVGNGILKILAGGQVNNTSATVGQESGSAGTVTVDGNGSTWNISDLFTVGDRGQGTVTVQNGGTINSNGLARLSDGGDFGLGTVTVDGPGSKWTNASGELFIARYGRATLNISNQGVVDFQGTDGNARLGIVRALGILNISSGGRLTLGGDAVVGAGGAGDVLVEGNNSSWEIAKSLDLGSGSSSVLRILNGGKVSNTTSRIDSATVTVDGIGSTWINSGDLAFVNRGFAELNILNGGLVTSVGGAIGGETVGRAVVTVDGNGSRWNNSGYLSVGSPGESFLEVWRGGQVTSQGTARIAENSTDRGEIDLRLGSSWTNNGELLIGVSGNGRLAILGGSQVNSDSARIGVNPGSKGDVIVSSAPNRVAVWENTGNVEVGFGGIGLLQVDYGTVTADNLLIGPNGTVRGTGTILANNMINSGGSVSPGLSPGILNLDGNYSDTPTSKINIEIGGRTAGTEYDQFNIAGAANFNGILNISLINGFTPNVGDRFDVVTYGSATGNLKITGLDIGGGRSVVPMLGANGLTFDVFNNIVGTQRNDLLCGTSKNDQIKGLDGNDILFGDQGDDLLYGDAGNDLLDGGLGHDQLYGGDGHDQLLGGSGNDILVGSRGCDVLKGGNGDDLLDGGKGNDILFADSGVDRFVLRRGDSTDLIWNFTDRQDSFLLADGLRFEDLKITQGIAGTLIQVRNPDSSSEILASLIGVNAKWIGVEDFAILPTANPGLVVL